MAKGTSSVGGGRRGAHQSSNMDKSKINTLINAGKSKPNLDSVKMNQSKVTNKPSKKMK
jgi:hypothetical protein